MPYQEHLLANIKTVHKNKKNRGEGVYHVGERRQGGRRGKGKEKGETTEVNEGWTTAGRKGGR